MKNGDSALTQISPFVTLLVCSLPAQKKECAVENRSESQEGKKSTRTTVYVRIGISFCALALLVLHRLYPGLFPSDVIGIGLLVVAILPWVLSVISEAELPGGWKVKFREVAEEQRRQSDEIEWIKFLMRNFLTQYELEHLKRLASLEPFWFDFNSSTKPYFDRELRRLLDLSLIEREPNKGIRGLLYDKEGIQKIDNKNMKDVKQYLHITRPGLGYLKMRDEMTDGETPTPTSPS